jgi:hypothetical protein
MIASAIMPQIYFQKRTADDRVSDFAGAGRPRRHRIVGRIVVSAEVIQFIVRPKHGRDRVDFSTTDFPTIAFRSAKRPDDLVMDHADTAPCEVLASRDYGAGDEK